MLCKLEHAHDGFAQPDAAGTLLIILCSAPQIEARLMAQTFRLLWLPKTCKAMPSPETSKGTVRQSRLSSKRLVLKSKCYGTGGKSSSHQPLAHELSTPLLSPRYLEHAFIPTALSNPTNLTISNFSSQLLPSIFWRILKKDTFLEALPFLLLRRSSREESLPG